MGTDYDLAMGGEVVVAGFSYRLDGVPVDCDRSDEWAALTLRDPSDGRAWVIMPNGMLMAWPKSTPAGVWRHLAPTSLTVEDLEVIGPTGH